MRRVASIPHPSTLESFNKLARAAEEYINKELKEPADFELSNIQRLIDMKMEQFPIKDKVQSEIARAEKCCLDDFFREQGRNAYFVMHTEFLNDPQELRLDLFEGKKHVNIGLKVSGDFIYDFYKDIIKEHTDTDIPTGSAENPRIAADFFLDHIWINPLIEGLFLSVPGQDKKRIIFHDLFRQMIDALDSIPEPEEEVIPQTVIPQNEVIPEPQEEIEVAEVSYQRESEEGIKIAEASEQPESEAGDLQKEWEIVEEEYND